MAELDPHVADAEVARNWLAAIVESSDDAIISKTLEGIIVTWNRGAELTFGYRAEEVIGLPITILIPPDHENEEPSILERLRKGERVDHYQTVRRCKDGTLLDISLTISPVRDAHGVIVGASKIARNITQQKAAERAVRESDARFRSLANSAPVLIWVADATRGCAWFNETWLGFTGRTVGQENGFGWTENVHPDDLAALLTAYSAAFDAKKPFRHQFRLGRHDGEWRWLTQSAVPLFESPGSGPSGYIGSCIDVTDFLRAEREKEELLGAERAARGEAERLSHLKDEFLATLSHELRTPLNAILGWATLLKRVPVGSADHTRGLDTIERNARAQSQIIGDLLDMSRIISGKVQLDVQPMDLQEVISAAVDAVRPSAEAKKLRLRVMLDAKAGRMRGDPNRLQQVFWNLLTNAVKFTPSGGRIDIVLERVNSHVEVSVEDSGVGIKSSFLPFVFDRFRQADASTTRRYGGLGLGLSIVKHLAELHGGSVRVKSAGEGMGSTFIIALPISAMRESEPPPRAERPAFAEVDVASVELPSLEGITALVVDDEQDARILINRLIEERGGTAFMASSAAEALEKLGKHRIDILVSDIGMPDVDGYQLIQKIRAQETPNHHLIAIALTAYARNDDRQRALLAGYQMHLAKPVDPRELIAGIASLLNIQTRVPETR